MVRNLTSTGPLLLSDLTFADGRIITSAISKSTDLSGRCLTEYLRKLLTERNVSLVTTAEFEYARDIKEKLCYVAEDLKEEVEANQILFEAAYEFYDGSTISVGSERYRAPEMLFTPSIAGKDTVGIHQLIFNSIMKCDVDIRAVCLPITFQLSIWS